MPQFDYRHGTSEYPYGPGYNFPYPTAHMVTPITGNGCGRSRRPRVSFRDETVVFRFHYPEFAIVCDPRCSRVGIAPLTDLHQLDILQFCPRLQATE